MRSGDNHLFNRSLSRASRDRRPWSTPVAAMAAVAAAVRGSRKTQVTEEVGRKGTPEEQRHYLHFKDVYINEGGGA